MLKKEIEELLQKCRGKNIKYCVVLTGLELFPTIYNVEETTIKNSGDEYFLVTDAIDMENTIAINMIAAIKVVVPFEQVKTSE